MLPDQEEWRAIADHPDYEVSNLGRVRSWIGSRWPQSKHFGVPKVLLPFPSGQYRYLAVSLTAQKKRYVHALVAEAFIGECPAGMEVNHKNTNNQDNHHGNLEYLTPRENTQHAIKNGRWKNKVHHDLATESFFEMFERLNRGESIASVSRLFGVSSGYVSAIKHGRKRRYERQLFEQTHAQVSTQ